MILDRYVGEPFQSCLAVGQELPDALRLQERTYQKRRFGRRSLMLGVRNLAWKPVLSQRMLFFLPMESALFI